MTRHAARWIANNPRTARPTPEDLRDGVGRILFMLQAQPNVATVARLARELAEAGDRPVDFYVERLMIRLTRPQGAADTGLRIGHPAN